MSSNAVTPPSPSPARSKRARAVLAADGCLLTAGAFSLGLGIAFGIHSLAADPLLSQIVSSSLSVVAVVVGPVAAWLGHRRRVDWTATLGALAGYFLGGVAVYALTLLAALFTGAVWFLARSEFGGAIAFLVLVAAAFLVLMVWLVIVAARDLAPKQRAYVRLDIARLVAAASVIAFSAGIAWFMTEGPSYDAEALVFVIAAGILGGTVVLSADFAVRHVKRQRGETGANSASPQRQR